MMIKGTRVAHAQILTRLAYEQSLDPQGRRFAQISVNAHPQCT
jgi:hypothetical protein